MIWSKWIEKCETNEKAQVKRLILKMVENYFDIEMERNANCISENPFSYYSIYVVFFNEVMCVRHR